MAISPFALFVKMTRTHPAFKGVPPRLRGKALGKIYRSMPPEEKAVLIEKAKQHPSVTHNVIRKSIFLKAKPFGIKREDVKRYWRQTKGSTETRLRAIAKMTKVRQPTNQNKKGVVGE